MPAHWVSDLEAYWRWLDLQIEFCPGWLVAPSDWLSPQLVMESDDAPVIALIVPSHRLLFPDGFILEFDMMIDDQLNQSHYSYHYQESRGSMMWRVCKNVFHIADVGQYCHVHLPINILSAADEIEFDEVLAAIQSGTVPGI